VPELAPDEEDLVIEKKRFSGFYDTELDGVLKDLAPDEVWVVGVCTSICVMDTVGDLCNRDIPVVVVENGVADFDEEFHRFALARMERVYGAKIIKW
jgi:nicotinamidase-related amidase